MAAAKGNRYAAKPNRMWSEMLHRKFTQDPDKLSRIADKLIAQAEEGDISAVREIADRLDGKAVQQVLMDATVTDKTVREYTDHELTALLAQKAAERPEQRKH